DLALAADGILEIGRFGAAGTDGALGPQGEERHPRRVLPAASGNGVDALDGQLARLLRRLAGAHGLDDEQAAADADDLLPDARAAGGAGGVVHIKPGADDRRIADAAVALVGQARGGADAAEVALLVHSEDGDGIVTVFREAFGQVRVARRALGGG